MQKSLLDWKHHQNEELEIQQELAQELWNLPWSSGTLNPAPTNLSPHTLSRLVYLCCLCSGPKNVFTHPDPQILVSNTTFQKSHLLPETHTPTSWSSVVNVHTIGLEGVTLQIASILTRQVHPSLAVLLWVTHPCILVTYDKRELLRVGAVTEKVPTETVGPIYIDFVLFNNELKISTSPLIN